MRPRTLAPPVLRQRVADVLAAHCPSSWPGDESEVTDDEWLAIADAVGEAFDLSRRNAEAQHAALSEPQATTQ